MTLGCPQGYAEKVSLISRGEGQMRLRALPFLLLKELKAVEGINWGYF